MRIVSLALVLLFPSLLSAQTWGQVGERSQGMGGAFVAVADDASAIYWNPAGLATGSTFDAQIDLNSPRHTSDGPSQGRNLFVGASLPVLALAYYRTHPAVSTSGDRKTEGSGELRVSALEVQNAGISLVQTVVKTLVMGSTLRLAHGGDRTAFDLDLGTMASMGEVRVGVAARNLRKSLDTQRQVRLGVAFVPRSLPNGVFGPFSAAFDIDLTETNTIFGNQREAALGSEQWWAHGLVGTRFGVHWNTIKANERAVAGGFTVKLPSSMFAEGHMTKSESGNETGWGAGLRVTF
jgi:hypothetical protein